MKLTEEQKQAKEQIVKLLLANEPYIVLSGIAGSGKTTTIRHIIADYKKKVTLLNGLSNTKPKNIVYLATTNKACKVLADTLGVPVLTVHRYFGIYFKQSIPNHLKLFSDCLFVIDECSFIDSGLFSTIKSITSNCQFIFMGDEAQLKPVNSESVVFSCGFPLVSLTKPIRQENKEIGDYVHQIREYIIDPIRNSFPKIKESNSFVRLERKEFKETIKNLADTDKVICATNSKVKTYNTFLFNKKMNRDHYEVGDTLVMNTYFQGIKTDTIVEIDTIEQGYLAGVKGVEITFVGYPDVVGFIPDKGQQSIIDYRKNFFEKYICDVRPAYAVTTHKAQGSTYNKVYIDLQNFSHIKSTLDLARMLYVAISRAKQQVIFTGDL